MTRAAVKPKPQTKKPAPAASKEAGTAKLRVGEGPGSVEYVRVERGPPKAYKPEYAKQVLEAAGTGGTDQEIMTMLGIGPDVMMLWKTCYPMFEAALRENAEANQRARTERVRSAIYQRAVGYELPSEKIVQVGNKVKRITTFEHIPADVGAAKLWMSVHEDRWRAATTINSTITVGQITQDMSPAEAAELWRATLDGAKMIEGEVVSSAENTEE